MDWSQMLGYAAKAASALKKAVDTLAEERDLLIPESMLNTALATLASRSKTLKGLNFQLHDDWFEVDVIYIHKGIEFRFHACFDVENITFDHHKQSIVLKERGQYQFETRAFASTLHRVCYSAWAFWCKTFQKTEPLIYVLQKIEGITIKDGVYRFDFSPYIRSKPALVATIYALDINTIRISESEIYLRGSADLRSINLLSELYKFLPEDNITPPAAPKDLKKVDFKQAEKEADEVIDKILAAKFKTDQQEP
jgi:hypothetical protein